MRYAERTKDNHHVGRTAAGNPVFANEDKYKDVAIDHGYMLLGLFRLWNMIEYYSPNRNITDNDWDDVLSKYIKILLRGRYEGI